MNRPTFSVSSLIGAVILFASLINAIRPVRQFVLGYTVKHDPQQELIHARSIVHGLGVDRLAYFDEEPGWQTIEAVGAYYDVQYAVAPAVLRRDSGEDQFALVNFRISKKPASRPGYTFMEDLGAGLALYRKR